MAKSVLSSSKHPQELVMKQIIELYSCVAIANAVTVLVDISESGEPAHRLKCPHAISVLAHELAHRLDNLHEAVTAGPAR